MTHSVFQVLIAFSVPESLTGVSLPLFAQFGKFETVDLAALKGDRQIVDALLID